jgi:DNA-binding CsgD family transcriptional regulator/pimeloyl-ACP methyl ester carboxylesterase
MRAWLELSGDTLSSMAPAGTLGRRRDRHPLPPGHLALPMDLPDRLGFRYVHSADGTSLAWTRFGAGPPLVVVPPVPLSNISGEWTVPLMRGVYGRLARTVELILYDGRGTGASQRAVTDLWPEALAADLGAVIAAAGVRPVSLLAIYFAVQPALMLAATRPELVSNVVVFGWAVDGPNAIGGPSKIALLDLIEHDWGLFTRTAALDWMGWGVGESGELVARSFRSATTPDVARAAIDAAGASDLRPFLGQVIQPTLVLHRREGEQLALEQSAGLAATLPQGRLHILEGASATLFFDDPDGTVDTIAGFAAPGRSLAARPPKATAELTERELDVLSLIAAGDSNGEIAARLGISVHTVERHAANLYRKIGARGRAEATAWAVRAGADRREPGGIP